MKPEKRPNNHVHVPSTLSFHFSLILSFISFLFIPFHPLFIPFHFIPFHPLFISFHFSHLVDLHRPYLHPHEE